MQKDQRMALRDGQGVPAYGDEELEVIEPVLWSFRAFVASLGWRILSLHIVLSQSTQGTPHRVAGSPSHLRCQHLPSSEPNGTLAIVLFYSLQTIHEVHNIK